MELTISNKHLGRAHLFWRAKEFNIVDVAKILQLTSEEEPQEPSECQGKFGLIVLVRATAVLNNSSFYYSMELSGVKLICF